MTDRDDLHGMGSERADQRAPNGTGDGPGAGPGDGAGAAPTLILLERAELAARARRLAAATQAEELLLAGRKRAAEIAASVPERVAAAVAAIRAEREAAVDAEVARIDASPAVARIAPGAPDGGADRAGDSAAEAAVALIVAAVLGEPWPAGVGRRTLARAEASGRAPEGG